GNARTLQGALEAYRRARVAWSDLAQTASVYAPDLTFGRVPNMRGHWSDRLAAIDSDIQDMEQRLEGLDGEGGVETVAADARRARPDVKCVHNPPGAFKKGEAVTLDLTVEDEARDSIGLHLHYRHVNQAESYEVADMQETESGFQAVIPGDYTHSPYPLQYWFELRDISGEAWLWPGLDADLSNQPYFVVRQAKDCAGMNSPRSAPRLFTG
ncbi:unnamed protein product, partial [marine sediment metagenome]